MPSISDLLAQEARLSAVRHEMTIAKLDAIKRQLSEIPNAVIRELDNIDPVWWRRARQQTRR